MLNIGLLILKVSLYLWKCLYYNAHLCLKESILTDSVMLFLLVLKLFFPRKFIGSWKETIVCVFCVCKSRLHFCKCLNSHTMTELLFSSLPLGGKSWGRSVIVMTRLQTGQLRNHGSVPGRVKIFFSPVKCPDWRQVPCSLLFNDCRVLVPQGQSGWGMKLTTHLCLMPRLRTCLITWPAPQTLWKSLAKATENLHACVAGT